MVQCAQYWCTGGHWDPGHIWVRAAGSDRGISRPYAHMRGRFCLVTLDLQKPLHLIGGSPLPFRKGRAAGLRRYRPLGTELRRRVFPHQRRAGS